MKSISITKGKTPFTIRISSCEKRSYGVGLNDEKRKFGDKCCGLIRGDEEVKALKDHSGQGGGCKITGKVSNKTNPVGSKRLG